MTRYLKQGEAPLEGEKFHGFVSIKKMEISESGTPMFYSNNISWKATYQL